MLRTSVDGFVSDLLISPGARVHKGDALVRATDPQLPLSIRVLEAQKAEMEARYQSETVDNQVRAQITLEQLKAIDADLARAREKEQDLTVRSPADGVFVVEAPQDLPARFLKKGERIGYVLTPSTTLARVLVPQQSVDMVRSRTTEVQVKLAERLGETIHAVIRREVPAASNRLSSPALGQSGGGTVALDPRGDAEHMRALQTHFEFELELPSAQPVGMGGHVYVRFEHGDETIAQQVYRSVRQMFLARFVV